MISEELKENILIDMMKIFEKNVSRDELRHYIEWYASIRTEITKDDLIDFIKVRQTLQLP